ncbi:MAG: cell division protein FtsL [Firmicutes bacterium]|nr:cell division protein FtsL [Bacillota bacterium]
MANKEARKKKKFVKKLRGEVSIIIAIVLTVLAIPVSMVYTQAMLSESNIELEAMKSEVKEQESLNESLKMQISELASLDTIQDVANENGLVYTNGNIKVVTNK